MLVGAEGVVENGGVINKLGSYQMAIAAKAHGIPFYVAAESYKVCLLSFVYLLHHSRYPMHLVSHSCLARHVCHWPPVRFAALH